MRDYDVTRGLAKNLEGDGLRGIAAEAFGTAEVRDGKVVASFGAIERLTAWTDGKRLYVDTEMKMGTPDGISTDTIRAYNRFLEKATGYTGKERSKRAQGPVKGKA